MNPSNFNPNDKYPYRYKNLCDTNFLTNNRNNQPTFITITPESVGVIHNKLLAGYLARYPILTPSNYRSQLLLALQYFDSELTRILTGDNNFFAQTQVNAIMEFLSRYNFNSNMNIFIAFNEQANKLFMSSVINPNTQSLLCNFAGILFSSYSLKKDIIAFERNTINSNSLLIESELLLGIINIAKSSSDFWTTTYSGGKDPQKFLVGDCVGYMAGWASAVNDELHNHGSLSESNSYYRMRCGFLWACAGSVTSFGQYPTRPKDPPVYVNPISQF